jgi:hypothetical protein
MLADAWRWLMQTATRVPWWVWVAIAVAVLWELSFRWREWAKVVSDRHQLLQALARKAYLEARLRRFIAMANEMISQLEANRNSLRLNPPGPPPPYRGHDFLQLRGLITDYVRTDFPIDAAFADWNILPYPSGLPGATLEEMKGRFEAALKDAYSRSVGVVNRYVDAIAAQDAEVTRLAARRGLEWIKFLPPRHPRELYVSLSMTIRAPSA